MRMMPPRFLSAATLLLDLLETSKPAGTRIGRFAYRALRPLLANTPVNVVGGPDRDATAAASSAFASPATDGAAAAKEIACKVWIEDAADASVRYMEANATLVRI